jgi:hypothetical protein
MRSPAPAGADWLPAAEAARALRLCPRQLAELKAQGIFKPGTHYYRTGLKRGRYVYGISECRQALLKMTAAQDDTAPETFSGDELQDGAA